MPTQEQHIVIATESPGHCTLTGEVFGDGSLQGPVGPWASVGWAVAKTSDVEPPGLLKALISPMQRELPVQKRVKRSEMAAFLYVLRNAVPPIVFVTDHKPIIRGM
jgi:hypothetical protein